MTVASIDIGTNTILCLIAKINLETKTITPLKDLQEIPRLGKGLMAGCNITSEKIEALFKILKSYDNIIKTYRCEKVYVTCTNAFRISSNGNELADEIVSRFGYEVKVVPGELEAELSFAGAVYNNDGTSLIIDIGGGSTEIIFGSTGNISYKKSFQAGVVAGTEKFELYKVSSERNVNGFTKFLNEIFYELEQNNFDTKNVIALAGTPVTLACITKNLTIYDEQKVEGSLLSLSDVVMISDQLAGLDTDNIINTFPQVAEVRKDVIFAGSIILKVLMQKLRIDSLKVSTKGIRYGALIKNLFL